MGRTTLFAYAFDFGSQGICGIFLGAIANHHIQQQHANLRLLSKASDFLITGRRVDHWVRFTLGVEIVPHIDNAVPVGIEH
ncbi:hypothetical protein D3C75_884670 [compost metagenome]